MKPGLNKFFAILAVVSGILWAGISKAVCPICVVAIGAGLGLSRWLGVDDTISSLWIGGILVAMIMWTLVEMRKRNKGFIFDAFVISAAYYLLTFVPLYYSGILGHPLNKILGTDKIIFGTTVGSIFFLIANWFHHYLKKQNNGKIFFPYQKVVIPFLFLLIISLILWRII